MKSQLISRSLTVLAFGLAATAVVAAPAAHAGAMATDGAAALDDDAVDATPTIQIVSPSNGSTVTANKKYEIQMSVTGPKSGKGTIYLEFPLASPAVKKSMSVDLDSEGNADISFTAGPNAPGKIGVYASVHFGGSKSKVVYTEWTVE